MMILKMIDIPCPRVVLQILLIFSTYAHAQYSELKMVHVIFRHGEKTPSSSVAKFPNDPYSDNDFFPEGRNALTNDGKMIIYKLGTFLRGRYNDFLGDVYYPEVARVRCTESTRTMMSAELVNAGLWPPSEIQKWNEDLPWIPIPYEYVPDQIDKLMCSYKCPTYVTEYERILQSEEVQNLLKPHREFFTYVSKHSGLNVTRPQQVFFIHHKLDAEKNCNLTLPNWTKGYFPDGEMYDVTLLEYKISGWGNLLKKLYGGPLLRDIFQNYKSLIEDTSSTKSNPKITLYSGHDSNVCSILHILGLWTPHVPDFSSAVIFELYSNNSTNKYGIQILYHLGRSGETIPLTLPGCTRICPIEEFTNLLSDVIPGDDEELCQESVRSGESRPVSISLKHSLYISLITYIIYKK